MTHDGPVWVAVLSGDETRTLSWSDVKTVRLWDWQPCRQIGPAMTHNGLVKGALTARMTESHYGGCDGRQIS
jgi:hypothetical protein